MTVPATCKVLALNVYIFAEKETIKFSTMLTLWVLNCIGWAVSVPWCATITEWLELMIGNN